MSDAGSANRPMTGAERLTLLSLAGLWGGSFFFQAIAVRDLPVLTVVATRVVLAAGVLLLVLRLRGERLASGRQIWLAFLGMGLLNNALPFSLYVWSQQHLTAGLASILNAATPLFTVIAAHWLTRDEKLTGAKLVGVLLGLGGVALVIGPDALRSLGTAVLAQFLCLAAALSYAFAGLFGRRFRAMGVTPLGTATGQLLASSALMLPMALVLDRPWQLAMPGLPVLTALASLALLSTALAYVLYFRLLASAGATRLLLVTFLIPISAILLGGLFLGEQLQPLQLAGMALIGSGLAAIDGRFFRSGRSHQGSAPADPLRPPAARPVDPGPGR